MKSAVSVKDLSVRYGARLAVANVDLKLTSGMTVAVIGPNGSGKSTLLHAIMGLVAPSGGSIDLHRRSVALVLQATNVDRSLPITVIETVRIARYENLGLFGRFRKLDHDAVINAMARMAVENLADRQLHELSGGQRQRVLVAQGLAQQADILLLDEPVAGLDMAAHEMILDIVAQERSAGRTVVMTTHDLDDASRCDRVLLMATRAVAFGEPGDVLKECHLRDAFGGQRLGLPDRPVFLDGQVFHDGRVVLDDGGLSRDLVLLDDLNQTR